jgi:23S rRNA (cytidine1920-2'-O)/16S rRNA (cytidine1409-2'-O)-methyltransferase
MDLTGGLEAARLDVAMVGRGLAPTRSRARDLIVRGLVCVDGVVCTKPALVVRESAFVVVVGDDAFAASRGGLKLKAALAAFEFDPAGATVLDVGASTGGFTEHLLARGAHQVYAVDVGRDQLHPRLKADRRVVSLEAQDSRTLDRVLIPQPITGIVVDVSFISLKKALPAALALAEPGAWLVALVKPQFEVGREGIGKGGIVRDDGLRAGAVAGIAAWLKDDMGWQVLPYIVSPITGGSGNTEYLIGATRLL